MNELEKTPSLTNDELTHGLVKLMVRFDRLEKAFIQLIDKIQEQMDFQDTEILKTRMFDMRADNKTPYKRLNELEDSFKGLVNWINSEQDKFSTSGKQKHRDII